ncbi:hypothetical protein Psuf_046030 [Phytohabitans suffuscus]|uniref:Uncharacterized protein n=2 Tax=Phytohabitans suffuscus TaxID=624315 RepID=A0A6F8YMG2_9ACTN|nr:hypothetical protein Psuf_046030 [Phytohabitans suffuscus]
MPAAGEGAILGGERQVAIVPVGSPESLLTLDGADRLILTKDRTDTGLFVLTPASGNQFRIRTATVGGGEPSCLRVKENGVNPLTIVAAACGTAKDDQLFVLEQQKGKDSSGRPTYAIAGLGEVYLLDTEDGLIAQELGHAGPPMAFAFVDKGPSTLPKVS